jgi:hypothetical protein
MSERGRFSRRPVDPENGLTVVWQSYPHESSSRYSIVRAPLWTPIAVRYSKPISEVDIKITPHSVFSREWQVSGLLDVNTLYNLGMPVRRRRINDTPAFISEQDLIKVEKFGLIKPESEKLQHFNIDLQLTDLHMSKFFSRVWQPLARRQGDVPVSMRELGRKGFKGRLLPQRIPSPERVLTRSTLQVVRR